MRMFWKYRSKCARPCREQSDCRWSSASGYLRHSMWRFTSRTFRLSRGQSEEEGVSRKMVMITGACLKNRSINWRKLLTRTKLKIDRNSTMSLTRHAFLLILAD